MSRTTVTAAVVNTMLRPASGGRKRPLEAWEKAVADVEKSTGWSVAGEEQFIADLGFHLRCLADEKRLTPFGWQSGLQDAKARLENRLRIRQRIQEHPEIADERIADPVFVVGLPRTATTLAHKILAASDDHRGPLLWEMLRTDVPVDPAESEKMIRTIEAGARMMVRFAPSWEVIHPIRARQPEESMFILPHGTFHLALRAALPEYKQWLGERDYTADYVYLKRALQVLQYGREPKRWTLKYPAHLNDLDVIRKVFPDAKFVWTHRDPSTVMGSVCSLMETSWSLYQRRPDLEPDRAGRARAAGRVDRARTCFADQALQRVHRGRALSPAELRPGERGPEALRGDRTPSGPRRTRTTSRASWPVPSATADTSTRCRATA